jgi:hypothetical protein
MAQITYVGVDEHKRTRVRVRSSNGSSAQTLQRVLKELMPFAIVRTSEDVLDGTAIAELVVPTVDDEYNLAVATESSRLPHAIVRSVARSMLMVGIGLWLASIVHDV